MEAPAVTNGGLLTVGEVAELLRVHPASVRRWIHSGHIRAVRLGDSDLGPLRVPSSELAHLLTAEHDRRVEVR